MISDKILFVIIIACAFFVMVVKEIVHYKERKDLYDRIMSDNLTEYKRESGKSEKNEKNIVSRHQEVMRAWRGEE